MSLQVWLPLNGNLNNNGVADVTITNNGATVNADGKIGSCYYFNGSSQIKITLPSTMTTIKNTSVCAFVKSTSSVLALGGISQDQSNTTACMTLYTSGWQFTGSSAYKYVSGGTIANTSVWHHVCCVMTDTDITTYLDGVQIKNVTIANAGVTNFDLTSSHFIEIGQDSPGTDEKLTGYVNDFRIYDHALSAKEVKEISKGLILHMPLDNNGAGAPNLLTNSADLTQWSKESGITVAWDTDKDLYKVTYSGSNSARYGIYQDLTIEANTTYTVSCILEGASGGVAFGFYDSSVGWPSNVITVTTGDGKISRSYTLTSSANSTKARFYLFTNGGSSKEVWFKLPKLEMNSKATPWCPNTADALYSSLGFNSSTVYDTSGYCNNGTISSTKPTIAPDSPRYSSSTLFANNIYVSIPLPSVTGFANSYTFSWWGKCNPDTGYSNRMYWGFSNGNRLNLYGGSDIYYWNTGDSYNNPFTDASIAGQSDGTWHHFAVTGDGTTNKLYIDGTFKANAITHRSITGTTIILNGWDTSNSYDFNGQLSDYRLYTTCLSADDIAELYKVPISIDNTGKVHAIEINEV